jgi:uncharacterized membrane protein
MRRVASLLLILVSAVFVMGAFVDPPFLRSVLKLSCHRLPERSFRLAPGLCARCTFFWTGVLASSLLMPFRKLPASITKGCLLLVPMIADGLLQFLGFYESTNFIRLITGLMGGAGICILLEGGGRDR